MKRQFVLMAAAVAAFLAVSCTKETPVDNSPVVAGMKEVTLTASVDMETKTAYDADGAFKNSCKTTAYYQSASVFGNRSGYGNVGNECEYEKC